MSDAKHRMRSFGIGHLLGLAGVPRPMIAKREPVAYLYNGVRLPKLPEWDRERYPYAHTWVHNVFGYASLHCSTSPVVAYVSENGTGLKYSEAGTYLGFVLPMPGGQWRTQIQSENGAGDPCGFDIEDNVWANHDVFHENGTVYISASAPIPVYE